MTIYTPKALVEFSQNVLFLRILEVISTQKNLKNRVKIRHFKGRFKKKRFEP
jgi:hypothetical protein